jgi:hypothetical protein
MLTNLSQVIVIRLRIVPPRVGHGVANPAGRAVHLLGGTMAGDADTVDKPKERNLALRQVANFSSPVILLCIDIEVEVVSPSHGACQSIIPNSLQGEGQW